MASVFFGTSKSNKIEKSKRAAIHNTYLNNSNDILFDARVKNIIAGFLKVEKKINLRI